MDKVSPYKTFLFFVLRKILSDRIKQHRLIFCINPGRSGSKYLAELLGTAVEVDSYHEPEPKMIGDYLRMVTDHPYGETLNRRSIKSIAIQNKLLGMQANQVYCETSHMFIKTYFDVVLKDFDNIQIIALRRDLSAVLKSFIECGYFSDDNPNWPKWMHSISDSPHAFPFVLNKNKPDAYDLSIAYLLDIEYRTVKFLKENPGIKNFQVNIEDLNRLEYVSQLFSELNITITDNTKKVLNCRINKKEKIKHRLDKTVSQDYCCHRISGFFHQLKQKRDLSKEMRHILNTYNY